MVAHVAVKPAGIAPKVLPALIVVGSITAVLGYVQNQLATSSQNMDRFFAPYNTPVSEASRRKAFEGFPDTRDAIFNVLSWK